jgi:CTP-dependent riboflavin kinase
MGVIEGKVISGLGEAARIIPRLKPHLKKYLQDIEKYHDGTINVLLDDPIEIRLPERVTEPLPWSDVPNYTERFGLTPGKLKLEGSLIQHGVWILIAEHSPHLLKTGVLELLAETIPGIQNNLRCNLTIERLRPARLCVV